ncbi:hypothetical protein AKJ08_1135 [Vulgatibacter incomptus]|uniref:Uncharacterized protein n=1 Tax=Vulgatibacter incomptus TaxID=1391653 RepID=A0A0K1PB42_9BACT|nr:hypothetical protein AKJ08_1135 [Vulgatibacter incomptus]
MFGENEAIDSFRHNRGIMIPLLPLKQREIEAPKSSRTSNGYALNDRHRA